MKTYHVEMQEVWMTVIKINAESKEQAILRIDNGEGEHIEGMVYSHTLDIDPQMITEGETDA